MMIVYRIVREKYLARPLQGIGAKLSTGFRWNSLGTPIVYTSGSRALSLLEIMVHLDLSEDLPTDRYSVSIEIPESIKTLGLNFRDLPPGWDQYPPATITQWIGDEFIQEREAAVLKLPSCIVKEEHNYLINPNHPEAKQIKVTNHSRLSLDQRFKG